MKIILLFLWLCLLAGCATTNNSPSIKSAGERDWKEPANPSFYDQRR